MGTPKTTKNELTRDGKSKEEGTKKEKKTATKKKVNVDDKQVQQEKKKNINEKKKDNSSGKINGTVKSKIRKHSNGNPNDSGNKRRRKEKDEDEDEKAEEEDSKPLNVFPMNRVQRIAKSEGSDFKMSQEAYFLINKAMEKFIGQFCEDAYDSAPPHDRRGFFKYRHLSSVVCTEKRYDFLSDFVPEKIKVEDALKEIKPEEET